MILMQLKSGVQKYLEGLNATFQIEYTTQSTKIVTDNFTYLGANKHLKPSALGFVNQVKRFAQKSTKEQVAISANDINYFKFSGHIRPGIYEGFTELDLNQAYWQIAYRKGYLSEEIYTKGLTVDKIVRLVALGSLASKKSCHSFDGKEYKFIEEKGDERTRSYFFDVAKEVDLLMSSTLSAFPQYVLFYWVDAFFVQADARDEIVEICRQHGLGLKEKKVNQIEVIQKPTHMLVNCYMEGETEPKPFIYVREENRAKYNINAHNETIARAKKAGLI